MGIIEHPIQTHQIRLLKFYVQQDGRNQFKTEIAAGGALGTSDKPKIVLTTRERGKPKFSYQKY